MSVVVSSHSSGVSFASPAAAAASSEPSSDSVVSLCSIDWLRHKQILSDYLLYHARVFTSPQSVQAFSSFIANADNANHPNTRAAALSKYYYDRLTREYAVTDLSLYKLGKIGLRWRTPAEILHGKGQFICASKDCQQLNQLVSMELEFFYQENGSLKKSLVKVRVCPNCAEQINYRKRRANAMSGSMKRKVEASAEEPMSRRRVDGEQSQDSGSVSPSPDSFPDASYQSPPKRALSIHSASTTPGSPSEDFAVPPPRLPRVRTPEQQANLERKRSLERERSVSPLSSDSLSSDSASNSPPSVAAIADRSPDDLTHLLP